MFFTLYDYLIMYQYKIIEAVKNGFPKKSDYNQWIYSEILNPLLDIQEDDYSIFEPGVYFLDDYYIGQTSKPIILRILNHLFETIPTLKTDITMQNTDKITCTKINLLIDNPLKVWVLSDDIHQEETLIKEYSEDYLLFNKIHNRNRKSLEEYYKDKYHIEGYSTPKKIVIEEVENAYGRGLNKYLDIISEAYTSGRETYYEMYEAKK